jgi:hypothetical protein
MGAVVVVVGLLRLQLVAALAVVVAMAALHNPVLTQQEAQPKDLQVKAIVVDYQVMAMLVAVVAVLGLLV